MNRRSRLTALRAGLVSILLVALAGCVGVPMTGPVIAGDRVNDEDAPASVLLPQGPEKDADPQAILQGFIRAGTGPQGDYEVAREFLTGEIAETWKPNAGVTVSRAGSENYSQTSPTTLEYSVLPAATVDAHGRYAQSETMGPQVMQFSFAQVDGQWRISAAPDGVVLTGSAFEQIFKPYSVYYFDPTFSYLVPDLRWFPTPSLARRIVVALLAGPTEWLAPGVVTEFPNGTSIGPDGVRIEANRVIVDLSAEAGEADDERLQRMQLQLQHSLREVTSVTSLSLSINQVDVVVPEIVPPGPAAEPDVDSRTLLSRDGEFGFYERGEIVPIEGISAAAASLGATSVTLDHSERYAAIGTPAGVYAATATGLPVLVDARPGLTDPAIDGQEMIWSAQTGSAASLITIDLAGTQHPIASQLPADASVHAIEVSRDGTRLAILLETDDITRLFVAAIVREGGVPTALGPPWELPLAADAVDATWADSTRVATLDAADSDYAVTLHAIGGLATSLGQLPFGSQLVGGNGQDGLRVLGSDGLVFQPRGTGWQSTTINAEFLGTRR
ncbi:LpqB family beta-propeller domain-containing protein [Salinibacterium sp. ZJ450]|uniref:LpqB family beta-propeller domain-containing protein n=1 Tax=Salinibacterium sp. ZJ450 TaxID=2708338 RepID=UPI00142236BC|nr:LpqB family beta-propeller domain-containing protein [Salinibacterium sp. ZJ450]